MCWKFGSDLRNQIIQRSFVVSGKGEEKKRNKEKK